MVLVFLLALGIRGVWIAGQESLISPTNGLTYPDERQYWAIAESIAARRGLVDEFGYRATFMPGYPAFLALFATHAHGLLLARVAQAVVGAAAVVPIYRIGRRVAGERAATLAALLVALDPFLVAASSLILTETIYTTLLCLGMLAAWPTAWSESRRVWLRAVVAGVVLAAGVYVRPSGAGFVIVWLIAGRLLTGRMGRGAAAMAAFGVFLFCLAPWAARNRAVIGEWRWLTTRSGISLYDGLGPRATGQSDLAYTRTPEAQRMSEVEWDRHWARESWRIAREDPARVARLAWAKLRRTWSFVPNEPASRTPFKMAVSAVWMIGVLTLAGIGLWRLRRGKIALLLLLPAIYFTVLHMVYVGSVRYRVPVMPAIYVLSGCATVCRRAAPPPEVTHG